MRGSCCINAIISIIAGIILAILAVTGTIFIIPPVFFGIALGIAVLLLVTAVVFAVVGGNDRFDGRRCLCRYLRCLTIGAIGGVIVSALALAIIELSVIVFAVFVFLATFFVLLGLLSLKDIIECIADQTCCR